MSNKTEIEEAKKWSEMANEHNITVNAWIARNHSDSN